MYRHVHEHVYRHVHRHTYEHVHRHTRPLPLCQFQSRTHYLDASPFEYSMAVQSLCSRYAAAEQSLYQSLRTNCTLSVSVCTLTVQSLIFTVHCPYAHCALAVAVAVALAKALTVRWQHSDCTLTITQQQLNPQATASCLRPVGKSVAATHRPRIRRRYTSAGLRCGPRPNQPDIWVVAGLIGPTPTPDMTTHQVLGPSARE